MTIETKLAGIWRTLSGMEVSPDREVQMQLYWALKDLTQETLALKTLMGEMLAAQGNQQEIVQNLQSDWEKLVVENSQLHTDVQNLLSASQQQQQRLDQQQFLLNVLNPQVVQLMQDREQEPSVEPPPTTDRPTMEAQWGVEESTPQETPASQQSDQLDTLSGLVVRVSLSAEQLAALQQGVPIVVRAVDRTTLIYLKEGSNEYVAYSQSDGVGSPLPTEAGS